MKSVRKFMKTPIDAVLVWNAQRRCRRAAYP